MGRFMIKSVDPFDTEYRSSSTHLWKFQCVEKESTMNQMVSGLEGALISFYDWSSFLLND